jgi:hypothetical protein
MSIGYQSHTGFSPSMTSCSKELRPEPHPKHPLQITTRTPKEPDFKFELLPLHSPLLRQSLLVSFPPLIDMLKFSGYPYLIRGQPKKIGGFGKTHIRLPEREKLLRLEPDGTATDFKAHPEVMPNTKQSLRVVMTLEQACPPEYQGAQCAFKDSMIH